MQTVWRGACTTFFAPLSTISQGRQPCQCVGLQPGLEVPQVAVQHGPGPSLIVSIGEITITLRTRSISTMAKCRERSNDVTSRRECVEGEMAVGEDGGLCRLGERLGGTTFHLHCDTRFRIAKQCGFQTAGHLRYPCSVDCRRKPLHLGKARISIKQNQRTLARAFEIRRLRT